MTEPYEDSNTISTDLISSTRKKNKATMELRNLSVAEKLIIQNQDVILMFIEKDHAKVKEMWDDFISKKKKNARWEPRVWQILLFVITLVIGAVLGRVF